MSAQPAADSSLFRTNRTDCWIAVKGQVYDVTPYLQEHPGGVAAIVMNAGKDATEDFEVRLCKSAPTASIALTFAHLPYKHAGDPLQKSVGHAGGISGRHPRGFFDNLLP
mgnify:CR=1 FL=1